MLHYVTNYVGRTGRNVRQIQDLSEAIIKLPENQDPDSEDVPVQVVGNIYSQTVSSNYIRSAEIGLKHAFPN